MSTAVCLHEDGETFLLLAESCNSVTSLFTRLLQAREQQESWEYPFMSSLVSMVANGYTNSHSGGNHDFLCSVMFPNEWIRYQREMEKNPSMKVLATIDINENHICIEFGHAAYPDRIGDFKVPLEGSLDLLKRMNGLGLGKLDEYFTLRSERFERELSFQFPSSGTRWLSSDMRKLVDDVAKHKLKAEGHLLQPYDVQGTSKAEEYPLQANNARYKPKVEKHPIQANDALGMLNTGEYPIQPNDNLEMER